MVTFDDSMVFKVTWHDRLASIDRPYKLFFYPMDNSIEIKDAKTGKLHLKRIRNGDINMNNLFVGNTIVLYGREYKISEFGDQMTKQALVNVKERTFVLIKPDAYINHGKILTEISQMGLSITQVRMAKFNPDMVAQLYPEHVSRPYFGQIVNFLTSDVVVGVEVSGDNCISMIKQQAGPTNPQIAKEQAAFTWRARFGDVGVRNAVHVAFDQGQAERELAFFFSEETRNAGFTAMLSNCSLCLIKPHIIASGMTGAVIDKILDEGFEISAIQTFFLQRAACEEFFDLYRGVIPDLGKTIDQMVSGPCIALEIRQDDVVRQFKQVAGAYDPNVGRQRHGEKTTIRSQFGADVHRNAVHCTDLVDEGPLDCEFFFVLLPERQSKLS